MTATEHQAHRWSGWPGAWCLDCGMADPWEEALADNLLDPEEIHRLVPVPPCPEPGSNRCNPYQRADDEPG